jgi:hypothetical protein
VGRLLDRMEAGTGGHLIVTGPPGAGKTALVAEAADRVRARGIPVHQASGTDPASGLLIWEQLLTDLGAGELPADSGQRELDRAARSLAGGGPRLLVVEDVDLAGERAVEFLALLVGRLGTGATALLVTARAPLGLTPEPRLSGLTEAELSRLTPGLSAEAVTPCGWPRTDCRERPSASPLGWADLTRP